jgi:hypothetical protein
MPAITRASPKSMFGLPKVGNRHAEALRPEACNRSSQQVVKEKRALRLPWQEKSSSPEPSCPPQLTPREEFSLVDLPSSGEWAFPTNLVFLTFLLVSARSAKTMCVQKIVRMRRNLHWRYEKEQQP